MAAPIVVSYCPEAGDCEGKFLQLVLDGVEHLVFAPSSRHTYHNQILERLLDEHGIPSRWDGQTLRVDHPACTWWAAGAFACSGPMARSSYGTARRPTAGSTRTALRGIFARPAHRGRS